MNGGVQVMAFPEPPKPRRNYFPFIMFVMIVLLICAGGWYYFLGRKPRVVMTLAVAPAKETPEADGCWPVGQGQVLLLANGEAKLVDVRDRKPMWSVRMPVQQPVDERWQAAINARFLKLQIRSEELAERRASLKTAQETKAFNDDVAKYQADVIATRNEASHPPPPAPPGAVEADYAGAGFQGKQFTSSDIPMIENRLKRRKDRIAQLARTLEAKRTSAKSALQLASLKQDEAKQTAMAAEQKADEKALRVAKGEPLEEEAPVVVEPVPVANTPPHVVCVGEMIWIIEDRRAFSLDRSNGALKSKLRLSGPIRSIVAGSGVLHIVASAGRGACQMTKIATSVAPTSVYAVAAPDDSAVSVDEGGDLTPTVASTRTTFGGTSSLLRADIRLIEKRVVPQEGMKPGSEEELSDTVNNSAARSLDEMSAIAKLMENDAERARGETKVWVDQSTYEVSIRRPFDAAAPEWKEQVTGFVQVFSTTNLSLLTAGTKLIAFDRTNKKLWESTLGAPVPIRKNGTDWDNVSPPCVEAGGRLYLADGAFLGAYDIATGTVAWRVPSVGIRKMQLDADGNIYVLSDNLSAEALTYVHDSTVCDGIPLTMKINPSNGKIVWQVEKYGDLWVSGNDVYVFREFTTPAEETSAAFGKHTTAARVKIFKLSRSDGAAIWEWFQPRMPRNVSVDGKTVAMFFSDELQIIHSIAM